MKSLIKKIVIIFGIVLFDQITKFVLEAKNFTILDGLLSFSSTHNTGSAWSMFQGQMLLFIMGAIIFVAIMFVFDYFEKQKGIIYFIAFTMVVAGAIGNVIDRIVFGYVRDFIKLDFINFPIFNVADMSLVVGAILFSIYVLFLAKEDVKK